MSLFWSARWLRCAISRRIRADFAEIGGAAAIGFFATAVAVGLLATRAVAAVLAELDELPLAGAALRITLLAAGLFPAGVLTACSALTDRLDVLAAAAGALAGAGDFADADALAAAGVRDGFTALVAAIPFSCLGAGDDFPLADLAAVGRADDLLPEAVFAVAPFPGFAGLDLAVAVPALADLVLAFADLADKPAAVFDFRGVAGPVPDVCLADVVDAARLAGGADADFVPTVALGGGAADFLSAACFEPDANGLAFADDFDF